MDALHKKKQQLEEIRAAREAKQRLVDNYVLSRPLPNKRVKDANRSSVRGRSPARGVSITVPSPVVLSSRRVSESFTLSQSRDVKMDDEINNTSTDLNVKIAGTSFVPAFSSPAVAGRASANSVFHPVETVITCSGASAVASASTAAFTRSMRNSFTSPERAVSLTHSVVNLCPPRHRSWEVWTLYEGAQHRCRHREGSFWCISSEVSKSGAPRLRELCTLLPAVMPERELRLIVSMASTELVFYGYCHCGIGSSSDGGGGGVDSKTRLSSTLPHKQCGAACGDVNVSKSLGLHVPCVLAAYEAPAPLSHVPETGMRRRERQGSHGTRTGAYSRMNEDENKKRNKRTNVSTGDIKSNRKMHYRNLSRSDDSGPSKTTVRETVAVEQSEMDEDSGSESLAGWELTGEEAVRSRLFGCAWDGHGTNHCPHNLTRCARQRNTTSSARMNYYSTRPYRNGESYDNENDGEDDYSDKDEEDQEQNDREDDRMCRSSRSPGLVLAWTAIPVTRRHMHSGAETTALSVPPRDPPQSTRSHRATAHEPEGGIEEEHKDNVEGEDEIAAVGLAEMRVPAMHRNSLAYVDESTPNDNNNHCDATNMGRNENCNKCSSMDGDSYVYADDDKEEVVMIVTPLVCDVAVTTLLVHPHEPHTVFAGTLSGRIMRWNLYASEWHTLTPRQLCDAALASSGTPFVLRAPAQPPNFASFPSLRAHRGPVIRLAVHGESEYYHLYSVSEEGTVCMWASSAATEMAHPSHNSSDKCSELGVDGAAGWALLASTCPALTRGSSSAALLSSPAASASSRLLPSLPVTVRRAYWGSNALGYVACAADFCPVRGTDAMGEVFVGTTGGWVLQGTSGDAHLLKLRLVVDPASQRATHLSLRSQHNNVYSHHVVSAAASSQNDSHTNDTINNTNNNCYPHWSSHCRTDTGTFTDGNNIDAIRHRVRRMTGVSDGVLDMSFAIAVLNTSVNDTRGVACSRETSAGAAVSAAPHATVRPSTFFPASTVTLLGRAPQDELGMSDRGRIGGDSRAPTPSISSNTNNTCDDSFEDKDMMQMMTQMTCGAKQTRRSAIVSLSVQPSCHIPIPNAYMFDTNNSCSTTAAGAGAGAGRQEKVSAPNTIVSSSHSSLPTQRSCDAAAINSLHSRGAAVLTSSVDGSCSVWFVGGEEDEADAFSTTSYAAAAAKVGLSALSSSAAATVFSSSPTAATLATAKVRPVRGTTSRVTALQWCSSQPGLFALGDASGVVGLWWTRYSLEMPIASVSLRQHNSDYCSFAEGRKMGIHDHTGSSNIGTVAGQGERGAPPELPLLLSDEQRTHAALLFASSLHTTAVVSSNHAINDCNTMSPAEDDHSPTSIRYQKERGESSGGSGVDRAGAGMGSLGGTRAVLSSNDAALEEWGAMAVTALTFSSDGMWLMVGTAGGAVHVLSVARSNTR